MLYVPVIFEGDKETEPECVVVGIYKSEAEAINNLIRKMVEECYIDYDYYVGIKKRLNKINSEEENNNTSDEDQTYSSDGTNSEEENNDTSSAMNSEEENNDTPDEDQIYSSSAMNSEEEFIEELIKIVDGKYENIEKICEKYGFQFGERWNCRIDAFPDV